MRRRRMFRILKVATIAILALGVFGLLVESLWNWLMPALFGARTITYWQALGVWILSRILFGSFHGRSHGRHWRARMIDRWEKMSPEERERFRERLRHRWGPYEEAEKA
jgi:hypothetical protein